MIESAERRVDEETKKTKIISNERNERRADSKVEESKVRLVG